MKTVIWVACSSMFAFLIASCLDDDGGEDENCIPLMACSTNPPTQARLSFDLSEHFEELEVRRGRAFETGTMVWRGSNPQSLVLPLGWYAARARYVHQGDTVMAIDGAELTYTDSENCGDTCYEPNHVTFDLALSPGVWAR
jgi:hypothetical protein